MTTTAAARRSKAARTATRPVLPASASKADTATPEVVYRNLLANWISVTPSRQVLVVATNPRIALEITRRLIKLGAGQTRKEWYISDMFGNAFVSHSGWENDEEAKRKAIDVFRSLMMKMAPSAGLLVTPLRPMIP